MNTITYKIPNISCQHCVHTIKTEVSELPGVMTVLGNLETKQVTIDYEEPASSETIEALLTEIDYPPEK